MHNAAEYTKQILAASLNISRIYQCFCKFFWRKKLMLVFCKDNLLRAALSKGMVQSSILYWSTDGNIKEFANNAKWTIFAILVYFWRIYVAISDRFIAICGRFVVISCHLVAISCLSKPFFPFSGHFCTLYCA